jgi:hypothetical protein
LSSTTRISLRPPASIVTWIDSPGVERVLGHPDRAAGFDHLPAAMRSMVGRRDGNRHGLMDLAAEYRTAGRAAKSVSLGRNESCS